MTALLADPVNLHDYQLRLPIFEGPLDVLLRLIERSQLVITDVSLIAVTDQFLDHVVGLGSAPPRVVADFTAVGSRLVLLKSRSLLPRPTQDSDDEIGNDLVHQLIEYRSVKGAAGHLAQLADAGDHAFGRADGGIARPEALAPRLAFHEPGLLARAIKRRLSVLPSPRNAFPVRRLVSLRDMIERVMTLVPHRGATRFSTMSSACTDRHELLTAFLALLILIRRRIVDADQATPFGEIDVRRASSDPIRLAEPYAGHAADD
ncbi:MAG: segregation and condensation protein A [Thermomicrobiales bacterium]